jgi:tRNA threonylcarbamoyl adenosine modification protein YeaZ
MVGERYLVIDSATEACSAALFEDDVLIAGEYCEPGRGHAERLVPMIAALPDHGRAARIMVDLGPGSFTGIRVGIAAARALGFAWNAPVGGYGSLDLVAAMAFARTGADAIDVVMTGGHGEWFFQSFAAPGRPLAPVASLPPESVLTNARGAVVAGSQAAAVAAVTGARACPLRPDARAFALLPRAAWRDDVAPVYGRAPDARLPPAPPQTLQTLTLSPSQRIPQPL